MVASVSGSRDSTIKIWDLESGAPLQTMVGHAYTVYCLEFDNRYIISGSVGINCAFTEAFIPRMGHSRISVTLSTISDKTIRVWAKATGNLLTILKGHSNSIRCLKFDKSHIVSGAWVPAIISCLYVSESERVRMLPGRDQSNNKSYLG